MAACISRRVKWSTSDRSKDRHGIEREATLAWGILQTGRIPRFVDGKVLPGTLRVPNASIRSSEGGLNRALAALHIGILAISNLPGPVCLPERNFAVFFRSPFSLPRPPLTSSPRPSSLRERVLFIVHKVYSPRDRRSFFCDSTSGSREVVPPVEPRSREAFSLRFRDTDRK